jgi:hypothetical protein
MRLDIYNYTTGQSMRCTTMAGLSPAYAPSEARLAAKFTTDITSWGYNNSPLTTSTIASNQFVWDNKIINNTLDANQNSVRYAGLNVATGALTVGPNNGSVTQSVALSAAAATGGQYRETYEIDRDYAQGYYLETYLEIVTATQGTLKFSAVAGDRMILVTPQLGNFSGPLPVLP